MDNSQEALTLALLEGCKAGEDDAFASLVSLYTPMMLSLIRRFSLEVEDAFSEVCMALYKAALYYDTEQSEVTFGLYAKICITNRLKDLARSPSFAPVPLSNYDIDRIAVSDRTQHRLESEEDSREFRRQARDMLSDYEYRVLIMWLSGLSTADISEKLGESAKSVDNAKARVIKKLRSSMRDSR